MQANRSGGSGCLVQARIKVREAGGCRQGRFKEGSKVRVVWFPNNGMGFHQGSTKVPLHFGSKLHAATSLDPEAGHGAAKEGGEVRDRELAAPCCSGRARLLDVHHPQVC